MAEPAFMDSIVSSSPATSFDKDDDMCGWRRAWELLRRQNLRPTAATKETPMVSDDDDEGCLISCPAKLTSTRGFLRAS